MYTEKHLTKSAIKTQPSKNGRELALLHKECVGKG